MLKIKATYKILFLFCIYLKISTKEFKIYFELPIICNEVLYLAWKFLKKCKKIVIFNFVLHIVLNKLTIIIIINPFTANLKLWHKMTRDRFKNISFEKTYLLWSWINPKSTKAFKTLLLLLRLLKRQHALNKISKSLNIMSPENLGLNFKVDLFINNLNFKMFLFYTNLILCEYNPLPIPLRGVCPWSDILGIFLNIFLENMVKLMKFISRAYDYTIS